MVHTTTAAAVVSAAVLLCLVCILDGVASQACIYKDPNGSTTYDLTSLGDEISKNKQSFRGWGPSFPNRNYTYLQSFCVAQPEGNCDCPKTGAASCQINSLGIPICDGVINNITVLAINFTIWNHIDPSTQGFVLWYQGGGRGCGARRTTQVLIKCGSENGIVSPVIEAAANGLPCLYLVQFTTPLVCVGGGIGGGSVIKNINRNL